MRAKFVNRVNETVDLISKWLPAKSFNEIIKTLSDKGITDPNDLLQYAIGKHNIDFYKYIVTNYKDNIFFNFNNIYVNIFKELGYSDKDIFELLLKSKNNNIIFLIQELSKHHYGLAVNVVKLVLNYLKKEKGYTNEKIIKIITNNSSLDQIADNIKDKYKYINEIKLLILNYLYENNFDFNNFNKKTLEEFLLMNDNVNLNRNIANILFSKKYLIKNASILEKIKSLFPNKDLTPYLSTSLKIDVGETNSIKPNSFFTKGMSTYNNEMLKIAIKKGADNTNISNDEAFMLALYKNDLELFKLLLKDPKNNPSNGGLRQLRYGDYDNGPIRVAARDGKENFIKLLLKDKRVDPTTNNNAPLRYAIQNNHINIIKLLLKDKRVANSITPQIIKKLSSLLKEHMNKNN